jgi:large subunit ribosomal protein L18
MYKRFDRKSARDRRKMRIRKRVRGTASVPRLSVFRSLRHIYVQVIDDVNGVTIAAASTMEKELAGKIKDLGKSTSSKEAAGVVGQIIAERAKEKTIESVCFDRGGNLYFGRVKALADEARKAGLKF